MISYFKFVPLTDVGSYLAKGWTIVDDMANTHHGAHALIMRWTGEGEPS